MGRAAGSPASDCDNDVHERPGVVEMMAAPDKCTGCKYGKVAPPRTQSALGFKGEGLITVRSPVCIIRQIMIEHWKEDPFVLIFFRGGDDMGRGRIY